MTQLVVTSPFGSYGRGARIADPATIATILSGPNHIFVVAVADGASPGGSITPLLPNAVTSVVSAPDPALAATYGYALDLTSIPNSLYKWSGIAWVIILQAGSGSVSTAPVNLGAPTISGTAQVGQTLTASAGSWTGAPTSYAYQWLRNGVAIQGATAVTYAPVSGDIGAVLTCAVTASNAAGASQPSASAGTSAVIASAPTGGVADFSDPANSGIAGAL